MKTNAFSNLCKYFYFLEFVVYQFFEINNLKLYDNKFSLLSHKKTGISSIKIPLNPPPFPKKKIVMEIK